MEGTLGEVTLSGAVGMDADELIQTAYRTVTLAGARKIRLHFTTGTTINSAGIAVLITMTSQARKARQPVEVTGLSQHYRKIFEMIGLTEYVKILEDGK
jgi:ABC-type transporter Mla MlaB component